MTKSNSWTIMSLTLEPQNERMTLTATLERAGKVIHIARLVDNVSPPQLANMLQSFASELRDHA